MLLGRFKLCHLKWWHFLSLLANLKGGAIITVMNEHTEELNKKKFITAVKRASNMKEFIKEIKKNLLDNFKIVAIHELGEFGVDDKERFLAFLMKEGNGSTSSSQEEKLIAAEFGTHIHNGIEAAFDYSKMNYPAFGEAEEEKQRKFEELQEKFPPVSASEAEFFSVFEALFNAGRYNILRCTLDDYPCLAIVSVSQGQDETRVRPMAILINEDIESKMEFPNPEE